MDGLNRETDHNVGGQHQHPHACRVLVVEDDRPTREVLTKALAFFGFRVHAADTLAGGRAEFDRGGEEDAVVLDLNLPDGNGVELLRQIRERKLPVRVAVCTASKDESLMSQVRELGPDAVFTKPFDLPPLLRWLGREEKRATSTAARPPEIVRATPRAASSRALEPRRIPVA